MKNNMIYRYKGRDYTAINGGMEVYNGLTTSGTFYKKGGVSYPSGVSGIPSGWNVIDI